MYKKTVPYKDYNEKPQNEQICLLLETRDVFKVIVELKSIFDWQESFEGEARTLSPEEMREFFNNFEAVILASWGKITPDGKGFDRTDRYEFEHSKLFSAFMDLLLSDITEVQKVMAEIMPKGMEDIVRKQGESLERLEQGATGEEAAALAAARARIAQLEANQVTPPAS